MNWFKKFRKASTEPPPGNEGIVETPLSNFTPRAQQVLALARKEADRFNHNYLGTEHILLGLIKLGQGVAVNVLQGMGIDLDTVRIAVEKEVGPGPDQKMIVNIPYTPRVKKVLALASKEAKALNHTYVGTEHILLGLLREGDGIAAKVLKNLNVDIEQTRRRILQELDPNFSPQCDDKTNSPASKETAPMQSRFEMPQNPDPTDPKPDSIDTSKRFDVYCAERTQEIVIYRNAMFKGIKKLYENRKYDFMSEFIELEQSDGQTIFLARSSVIKFCQHGATPNAETIPTKKPAA
jgi:hypothetical protein